MKFFLPPAALDQHVAILGKTGSGKTFTAKGVVEHVLRAGRQTCVIDPTGAWWGLRLDADGKRRGLDVVLLGGAHADIPLAERSGAAVARLVTEQGASVVIDTSGLTVGEYTRWFIDFAGTLYTSVKNPLHLVIDEAHYFMPQGRVPDVDAGKMLHAGNRLMSGGRSRGIRGMLITQRPAKLHKDSLTCADTLIAMRMIAPQDREAVKDWIDGMGDPAKGKAVLDSLAQLQRGEGWVWYPEGGHLERVKFPAIGTYDSSAAPRHGAKAQPKVGAIDLSEVTAALAEAVKEAEANDPRLLRAEVAKLKAELAKKPAMEVKPVEVPVITDAQLAEMKTVVELISTAAKHTDAAWKAFEKVGDTWQKAIDHVQGRRETNSVPKVLPMPRQTPRAPIRAEVDQLNCSLSKAERLILTALAQHGDAAKTKVAILAGYAVTGGGFNNAIGALRSKGLLEPGSDPVRATEAGIAALGSYTPLPSGQALLDHWRRQLGKAEREILDVLAETYPAGLSKEETAARTASGYEPSGGGFNNALGRLRTLELIEGDRTALRASGALFG